MTEQELRRVMSGDEQAVRAFMREFVPMLRATVRRTLLGQFAAAEDDILQEILLGLFRDDARALRAWDPAGGRSLKNFLMVFAQHRALDQRRVLRRHDVGQGQDEDAIDGVPEPRSSAGQVDARLWLEKLMTRFQADCKPEDLQIFEMTYYQDLPVAAIAVAVGLSEAAVFQRRHRLRIRLLQLRDELQAEPATSGSPSGVRKPL